MPRSFVETLWIDARDLAACTDFCHLLSPHAQPPRSPSSKQLRSLFYVTECETASQEVFFFRKPVWAKFRHVQFLYEVVIFYHLCARPVERLHALRWRDQKNRPFRERHVIGRRDFGDLSDALKTHAIYHTYPRPSFPPPVPFWPPTRAPHHRTACLRHLTERQYRRISAQEAFGTNDGHDQEVGTDRLLFQPFQHGSVCTQDTAFPGRKPGGRGGGKTWAFPVSGVRLVPKPNGVRAIANLSKRLWADKDSVQWIKGVPLPVRKPFFFFFCC